ncbi:hypothetical protein M5D96_009271 [Drosophila gunungcola]|uniref:Uncharacterized protein n=1 Tax=Drosophila gunungcola TaxID=103775 RepID=A0A9P9YJ73_9MUSC|nr:hypothetical protein M5D96_009271 [Drosophila gunungcola]
MERKATDIVGFAVDGYYMPLEPGWDEKLPIWPHRRLKRLAICSWTHAADYLERYTCMTDLQLLCLPQLEPSERRHSGQIRRALVLKQREPYKQKPGFGRSPPLLLYYELSGFEDFVDKANLKSSPEYRGYIVFTADFPVGSERGLSFVDRGYQFEFDCPLNM